MSSCYVNKRHEICSQNFVRRLAKGMQVIPLSPVAFALGVLSIAYILVPQLNVVYFNWWTLVVLCSISFVVRKRYTFWLIYRTLPRDLKAGFRFGKLTLAVHLAKWGNKSIAAIFKANVEKNPDKVAFICDDKEWTFRQVDEYSNRVGNFLVESGYVKGDCLALYMNNCVEYICIWLGASKVGVVVALVNSNLRHGSLVSSLESAKCKLIITDADLAQGVHEIKDDITELPVWVHGFSLDKQDENQKEGFVDLDAKIKESPNTDPPSMSSINFKDKMIYIYTSGTTGLPKAAVVTNSRYLVFCTGVYYMSGMGTSEVIYNPLPLYHSAGGIVGIGQVLVYNNTCVIRKKFSASQYWIEANKYGCTAGQYVGEICRYLLNSPVKPEDKQHKVSLLFGNGLRPELWSDFTRRFNNPRMCEFYGSTEGIVNLINIEGHPGCVGFLSVLVPFAIPALLIKRDPDTGEHLRDENGLCIRAAPGEAGEIVGVIKVNNPIGEFIGYTNKTANQKKVIRDVIRKGDGCFLSGDMLVMDELGYCYFKDRMGDTFRWRGENVSTTDVEGQIARIVGDKDTAVYGVQVPGSEGRAGMAAIVSPDAPLDLESLLTEIKKLLPAYARPLFLRKLSHIDATGTYKLKKSDLQKEGYNIKDIKDPLFFLDSKQDKYVPLTTELYDTISEGKAGL